MRAAKLTQKPPGPTGRFSDGRMGSGRESGILIQYLHVTRPLRLEFPGAFYHVTSRGNARKKIFRNDKDRDQFLFIFAAAIKKHNWRCHTYCLMDNHYHLVIETVDPTLSKGMQDLNGNFTQWFNARHKTVGHIFQGRFKAFLIEEQRYLLNVARYVVLNPVRANMVEIPQDYKWSSYRILSGLDKSFDWFTTSKILEQFSQNKKKACRQYQKFVMEGIDLPSPMLDAGKGGVLGTEQFIDELRDAVNGKIEENELTISQRFVGRPTLKKLFNETKGMRDRNAAIAIALNLLHYSGADVGKFLHLDPSTVRKIARVFTK